MFEGIFDYLTVVDDFYWQYVGFGLLILTGLYFSYRSRFFQIRVIGKLPSTIKQLMSVSEKEMPGVSPIRLYFASIGGMIGLGNIVGVTLALVIGGPGSLFWLWIAAFAGMIIKYCEIYLGVQYRERNAQGGYDGGMMFCMPKAFKNKFGIIIANLSALLLCIYGVEVYQFTVITETLHSVVPSIDREWVILPLMMFIIYIGLGGIKRLANVCSILMPAFILLYVAMCCYIVFIYADALPAMFTDVMRSAFMGSAAVGGFAGAGVLMAAHQGAAKAVYSGDIAIGFDSIIQSETKVLDPQYQARLAIVSSLSDVIICTLSIAVVYLTGLWKNPDALQVSSLASDALSLHIPYARMFIVVIIFLAGFTTIQAYFNVGIKAAKYLSPKRGKILYFVYAALSFWIFAHYDPSKVMLIMSLSGGGLILLNLMCIVKLRKDIRFDLLK